MFLYKQFLWLTRSSVGVYPTCPNVCMIYALNPESAARLTVPLCIALLESLLALVSLDFVSDLGIFIRIISIYISYVDHTNIVEKGCQPFL